MLRPRERYNQSHDAAPFPQYRHGMGKLQRSLHGEELDEHLRLGGRLAGGIEWDLDGYG